MKNSRTAILIQKEKGHSKAKNSEDYDECIDQSFDSSCTKIICIDLSVNFATTNVTESWKENIKLSMATRLYTRYGDWTTTPPSCSLVAFTINTTRSIVIETGFRIDVT